MATLTAYNNETGLPERITNVRTGSAIGARRINADFARWYLANAKRLSLYVDVKRGPTGRTIERRGDGFYTRVKL